MEDKIKFLKQIVALLEEANKDVIDKSRIEEKLKEFKKRIKEEYDYGCKYCGNDCPYYAGCELCKELLREE